MRRKQILTLLMSAILLCSNLPGLQVLAEDNTTNGAPLVLEDNDLHVQFETDGTFLVTDKKSRNSFASSLSTEDDSFSETVYKHLVSSELVVRYYITEESRTSNLTDVAYSTNASAEVLRENEHIRVKYDFTECEVKVEVLYTLQKGYFEASIDLDSVDEYGKFSVRKMELLPGFGAGTERDEGYMLVPDGSGALIYFNNGETATYQADLYGEETTQLVSLKKSKKETVRMPVFGIVNEDAAVFGIIDDGDAISAISAISGNSIQNYNAVYSGVNMAFTSSKEMFASSHWNASTAYYKTKQTDGIEAYSVKYCFLSGEDANYSGMAREYREYLIREKGLKKNVSEPTLNVDLIGAIDVKKNFLGFTYYKPIALTTYEQVEAISGSLKEAGIDSLSLRYIGWNNDGISNERVLKNLKTMRVLGGTGDFEHMSEALEENNVEITYDIHFDQFYKGSKKYKVMNPFNEALESARYLRSVYATDINTRIWYQLTPSKWSEVLEKVLSSKDKLGVEAVSLTSLTSDIYSDFRASAPFTRGEAKNAAIDIMTGMEDVKLSGNKVNAYAFPYVEKIYEAPSYTSGYFVLDEEIPFYQMTLHGYVDMTAPAQFTSENKTINFLKAVETGMQLQYTGIYSSTDKVKNTDYDYLYGTEYKLWISDATEKYMKYQPLLAKIYDSEIVSHIKLTDNVYQTSYENGVVVIVNYNETAVNINGIEIAEYGFCEVMQ